MRSSSPGWLADELARSWQRQWPDLPDAFDEAASYAAPTVAELHRLPAPLGLAAASDDLIHPAAVAAEWAAAAPRAALRVLNLDDFGPRPAALGAACEADEWVADAAALERPLFPEVDRATGRFLLGSTVVLLPPGPLGFDPAWAPGAAVRLGQPMVQRD